MLAFSRVPLKHIPRVLANTFPDTEHFANKKSCFSLITGNLEYFARLVLHCHTTSPLSITTAEYRLVISASSVVENTSLLVNACKSFFVMTKNRKTLLTNTRFLITNIQRGRATLLN